MRFLKSLFVAALAVPASVLGMNPQAVHDNHRNAVEQIASAFSQHVSGFSQLTDLLGSAHVEASKFQLAGFQTQDSATQDGSTAVPSQDCLTALTTFSTGMQSCSTSMSVLISTNGRQSADNYASFCGSNGCSSTIQSGLDTLRSKCSSDISSGNVAITAALSALKSYVQLISTSCTKVGDTYCMPQFYNSINPLINQGKSQSIDSSLPSVSNSQLNQICSNCTQVLLTAFAQSGVLSGSDSLGVASSASSLSFMCVKDADGSYCYNKVRPVMTSGSISSSNYGALCSPCLRGMVAALPSKSSSLDDSMAQLGPLCKKGADGVACLNKFAGFETFTDCKVVINNQTVTNPCGCDNQPSCSTECKTYINNFSTSMGCCLGTFLQFAKDSAKAKGKDGPTDDQISAGTCGASIASQCTVSKAVKVVLKFGNIKKSWYDVAANKKTLDAAVIADLIRNTGAQNATIASSATVSQAHHFAVLADGVQLTATVTPDSDAQASTIQSSAQSGSFTSVASAVPATALNDQTQSSAPSSVAAESVDSGNSASSAIASMFAVVLAVVVAVVAQQA